MNANQQIYDENWLSWRDMKVYGPASRWLRWLIASCLTSLEHDSIRSAIDVGCGEGTTTAMLAAALPQATVTGIDFSESGIAMAQQTYTSSNLSFAKDTDSARLRPGEYDLVTCFEVLEHVDDWQSLLGHICDASKRSVILSFPTGRMRDYEVHVGHVRNFVKGEVEAFMRTRGFKPTRVFYAGFPFFSPFYRDLCNLMDAGGTSFTRGRYGLKQKAVSAVLFTLFRYFSVRRLGDQFCGAFSRSAP